MLGDSEKIAGLSEYVLHFSPYFWLGHQSLFSGARTIAKSNFMPSHSALHALETPQGKNKLACSFEQ